MEETTERENARPDGADHHGQDGGRDTVTVGQAQHDMAGDAEQNAPAMSQNNATDEEKWAGILAQTRADLPGADDDALVARVRQRAEQSGIPLSDEQARALVSQN